MTLPPVSTKNSLAYVLAAVQNFAASAKQAAISAVGSMSTGTIDSKFAFSLVDSLINLIAQLNALKTTVGLNAYAQAQVPGYVGTMSTDIQATIDAAQACVNWLVMNFPKDSTAVFILSDVLNADGTRTPRSFTSAQTAPWQTLFNTLIATIG